MKIKFLGTAAAEGLPAVFCNCTCCNEARKLGGKNIRTRHQTIINEDLLIDLPADTYFHVLQHGLRLDKVKYLLVTHAHKDHFYPAELKNKVHFFAHNQQEEQLLAYGGEGAKNLFEKDTSPFLSERFKDVIIFNLVENFKPFPLGDDYIITALPARHDLNNDAKFYIIEKDGKRILYAHDTGIFYDEVYEYIEKNNLYFDFITLDCTNVTLEGSDEGTHMGFCQVTKVIKKLQEIKAIDQNTIKYVNHFSHNGNALHSYVESVASEYEINVAFDGEEITL